MPDYIEVDIYGAVNNGCVAPGVLAPGTVRFDADINRTYALAPVKPPGIERYYEFFAADVTTIGWALHRYSGAGCSGTDTAYGTTFRVTVRCAEREDRRYHWMVNFQSTSVLASLTDVSGSARLPDKSICDADTIPYSAMANKSSQGAWVYDFSGLGMSVTPIFL